MAKKVYYPYPEESLKISKEYLMDDQHRGYEERKLRLLGEARAADRLGQQDAIFSNWEDYYRRWAPVHGFLDKNLEACQQALRIATRFRMLQEYYLPGWPIRNWSPRLVRERLYLALISKDDLALHWMTQMQWPALEPLGYEYMGYELPGSYTYSVVLHHLALEGDWEYHAHFLRRWDQAKENGKYQHEHVADDVLFHKALAQGDVAGMEKAIRGYFRPADLEYWTDAFLPDSSVMLVPAVTLILLAHRLGYPLSVDHPGIPMDLIGFKAPEAPMPYDFMNVDFWNPPWQRFEDKAPWYRILIPRPPGQPPLRYRDWRPQLSTPEGGELRWVKPGEQIFH